MKRKLLSFCLSLVFFLSSAVAFGQSITVSGTVENEKGEPLSGTAVRIKGESKGFVIVNNNGKFSITTEIGKTIEFLAVGYVGKSVVVESTAPLDIVLVQNEDTTLNDVVVTAMGVRRNVNTLPYAAQQVEGNEVSKTNNLNPVSSLSGKIAGLQITQANTMGGSSNVILRGIKSITQSNQALFVVDGVPYDNTNQSMSSFDLGNVAADLNGDDIASISVLKGAAASALYGSRAANGVIMITTKKAQSNSLRVSVSFGAVVGFVDNSTLPTYQTQYGQGYGSSGNQGNPSQYSFFYYEPIFNSNGASVPIVPTDVDQATGAAFDPSLNVYTWNSFMPGDPLYGKTSPWAAAKDYKPQNYFVTPVTTSTNISVYGGGSNGDFKMVYRNDNDKDFMPNSHLQKNNLTIGATRNLFANLSIGGDFNYQNTIATNRYMYAYTGTTSPMTDFRQWWAPNISLSELKNDYYHANPFGGVANATWNWGQSAYMNNNSYAALSSSAARPAYHDNPYWYAYTNYENDRRDRFFGNVHLDYKLNSLLHIMARVAKDYYQEMVQTRSDVGSQSTPGYYRFNGSHDEMNYDLQVNLNVALTHDLNLTALLGGNIRQDVDQSLSNATSGGLVVPGIFSMANSVGTPSTPVASNTYIYGTAGAPAEFYGKKEVDGIYGQATLNYKDLLTLDGSLRRDKSSTLPTNNNVYWYPSVSLNFQFAQLLRNWTWLSHGKVWANYAEVANDAPIYSIYNLYSLLSPFNGQTTASVPSTNNNTNLLPETQKGWETGIEAAFLNNRLGFSVTYYSTRQINQIMPISVSTATGYGYFYENGGSIQNSGLEVQVNLTPVRTKNFQWDMVINWSNNKQKVLSLYNNQPQYTVASYQNSIRLEAIPGHSYQIQGTDYVYKNGQRVIDDNGYYEIAPNSYTNLGTPFPTWRGGINNSFRYKAFTLSFLVDVSHGGYVYSLDMDYGSGSGLYPRTAGLNDRGKPVRSPIADGGGIILKGVHEDGTPNTTRIEESDINTGDYTFSSAYGEADREFVYDASYIKLRELNLTYSLPSSIFRNIKYLRGIDISLMGRNLWIIHKNEPYADPEQGQASGNASMGFQNGAYPTYRNIGLNVKFNF